jgi:hypothetical protein
MADVHEVEAAVGEDDPLLVGTRPFQKRNQFRTGYDFARHRFIIPTVWKDRKTPGGLLVVIVTYAAQPDHCTMPGDDGVHGLDRLAPALVVQARGDRDE